MLNSDQKELVKELRKEAHQVKECAVQYFVRSTIFVAAFIGISLSLMSYSELAAFSTLIVLPVLYANTKILLHKYGTASRNLGYELHLERSQHLNELYKSKFVWKEEYGNIGWEEAMRAWRIVQASIFKSLFDVKNNCYSDAVKDIKYPWFDIKLLLDGSSNDKTSFYSSSFLRNMISVVYLLMLVSLIPVFFYMLNNFGFNYSTVFSVLAILGAGLYIHKIIKFTNWRRYQIENGILSISSSSITWHVVILAHFRALEARKGRKEDVRTIQNGYTYSVSVQASRLVENIGNIHDWIEGKWMRKMERSTFSQFRSVNSIGSDKIEFKVVDHSNGGFGAYVEDPSKLSLKKLIEFKEADVSSGEIVHISEESSDHGYKVGIKFVEAVVA